MALVTEIAIEGAAIALSEDLAPLPGEEVVQIQDVLRQIEQARAAGARVLLLHIDSTGGEFGAALVLYDALRTFAERGGSVVVYVSDFAASAAAFAILGADVIVTHPQGSIWVHGARVDEGGSYATACMDDQERAAYCARPGAALLAAHTLASQADIDRWLLTPSTADNPGGEELGAKRAREVGFVDFVGGRERAREVARQLAAGEKVWSERREKLEERGADPERARALRDVREGARTLALMWGAP